MGYEPKDGKYNSSFYYVPEEITTNVADQLKKNPVAIVGVAHADYNSIYDIETWLEAEHWAIYWDQKNYKIYVAKSEEDLTAWKKR